MTNCIVCRTNNFTNLLRGKRLKQINNIIMNISTGIEDNGHASIEKKEIFEYRKWAYKLYKNNYFCSILFNFML